MRRVGSFIDVGESGRRSSRGTHGRASCFLVGCGGWNQVGRGVILVVQKDSITNREVCGLAHDARVAWRCCTLAHGRWIEPAVRRIL